VASSRYLSYPFVIDARQLMSRAFDYMKLKIPGWSPSEGQLDVWVIEATAGEAANIGTLVSQVPNAIFRYFGSTILGIRPVEAASAITTSTWFLNDSNGHTIPAGTQVTIDNEAGVPIPFQVLSEVMVFGGELQTTVGEVTLIAVFPGSEANNLGIADGSVDLIDTIAWVDHITQIGPTHGGEDQESDDAYLDRLSVLLQTMSPEPILPNDFAILARNVPGVQRATAVDLYDPASGSFNNERMVTIVALDESGVGINTETKLALDTYMESMREINFVVNIADPVISTVDVTTNFTVLSGYSIDDTEVRVESALRTYLDPRYWGVDRTDDSSNPISWNNITIVRYLELATLINNIPGVDIVTLLSIGVNGGPQTNQDITLSGVVPLPTPGVVVAVGS
jgi:uncharacterized phage protein gp47/JayE